MKSTSAVMSAGGSEPHPPGTSKTSMLGALSKVWVGNESFVGALRPVSVQAHTTIWHLVSLQYLAIHFHSVQEAWFRTPEPLKSHADPQVESPQSNGIDLVAYGTQDGIQIPKPFF